MNPNNRHQVTGVATAVLDYLGRHPMNADTREGIVRWWILEQQLWEHMDTVDAALDGLVKQGRIECASLAGRTIYRVAGILAAGEEQNG